MSERMTGERLARIFTGRILSSEKGELFDEIQRARASEAEKDAVIKALADALWDARQYGDESSELCWCQAPCAGMEPDRRNQKCEAKVEALRLAGRLP